MESEADVITVFGRHPVYFEYHKKAGITQSAVMVNGALSTTTYSSQAIRNLEDHAKLSTIYTQGR